MIFQVEDTEHAEIQGSYAKLEEAIYELRLRAKIPWDESPNVAPCQSWKTCGRSYEIIEYDDAVTPWKIVRNYGGVEISRDSIKWTLDDIKK
jgi:hypothetical protein